MTIDLAAIKEQHLPHMDWRMIFKDSEQVPAEEASKMEEYFARFLPPAEGLPCINCHRPLGGLLGTFTWRIQHGEGECGHCGYPARAIHYDVGVIKSFECILQYHPDGLHTSEEEA